MVATIGQIDYMFSNKKISLVIPHYPSISTDLVLDKCLESFKGQYDELVLISNDGMGYGPAVNLGLKYSSGDYIVVSNNDIILLDGELVNLIDKKGFTVPNITPPPKDDMPRPFFCIPRWVYKRLLERDGFFYDPRFETGYWEDDDLIMRIKDIPVTKIESVTIEHLNGGGLTMKQMGEQRWGDINQKVFKEKWG